MKQVESVLGPISSADMGLTLTHEHLLNDVLSWWHPPLDDSPRSRELVDEKVSITNIWELKHDPFIKEWLQTKDKSGVTPCRYTADIGGGDICSRADCKFSHARAMTLCTHCLKMGHFWKECTDRKAGKAAAAFPKPT
jgi:hypothetical protein